MSYRILILLTTIFFYAEGVNAQLIRFEGLYETECDFENDDEGEQSYLRFYPNGKVISVGTDCEGEAADLKDWFTIENKKGSLGEFKINGRKIKFTTKSNIGSVEYKGRITKDGSLKLKSKSLINGYRGQEEYKFVEVSD